MNEQHGEVLPTRRRRSWAEIETVVAGFKTSGLSRTDFCRKYVVSLSTLNRHLKRARKAQGGSAGVNLVAVELCEARASAGKGDHSGLAVTLPGGRRIEVARGFDAPTLVQLLGVLERL